MMLSRAAVCTRELNTHWGGIFLGNSAYTNDGLMAVCTYRTFCCVDLLAIDYVRMINSHELRTLTKVEYDLKF